MTFEVHISGNAEWDSPEFPFFLVQSKYFEIGHQWEGGAFRSESFGLPTSDPFDLQLRVGVGANSAEAGYRELVDGDQLILFAVNPSMFLANVVHGGHRRARCVVECPDGTSGQDCVTCESSSGIRIKVCC